MSDYGQIEEYRRTDAELMDDMRDFLRHHFFDADGFYEKYGRKLGDEMLESLRYHFYHLVTVAETDVLDAEAKRQLGLIRERRKALHMH